MSELPEPLVPAEVDLRDFREMPLEFERLFASDTWVLGTPEEKVAAIHLWCKSWHQQPAGSLPDDDRMLAHLSGAALRWKKLRVHALRGWVKCSDGRFYHPVVAAKAVRAWKAKVEQRARTHAARIAALKKKLESAATDHDRGLLQAQLTALLHETPVPVTETKGREGKGREEKGKVREAGAAAAPRRPAKPQPKTGPAWQAYTAAFVQRYGVEPTRNAVENAAMAAFCDLVPLDEAPDIAAFYVQHNKAWYVSHQHSVKYLRQDAVGLRTQWLAGKATTETSARQADRTAARGQVFLDLIQESREKTA